MTKHFLPDIFGRATGGDLFDSLRRDVDQVFRDFGRGWPRIETPGTPHAAGVDDQSFRDRRALEVTAELPGVDAKDVDVEFRDGMLTIRGEKKQERQEGGNKNLRILERSYGMFERSFALPVDVEADKIAADFEKGVLKVVLPKAPQAKTQVKKIEVKPAA
ncbi:MAG: Hsp20/alpha crystallin family protein [Rhizobiales bacterium]|nr:Hsp20/alpha crystallin family protein [Hyphomicrobiales bacterium]